MLSRLKFSLLKRLLLYAGLEKSDFDAIAQDALKANQKSLKTYSLLAMVAFVGLYIASWLFIDFTDVNRFYYGVMAEFNAVLFLFVWIVLPKHPGAILPAAYLFMGGLYAFSMMVTFLHPEFPAVTTIVLLFAIPFLFYDRPVRMILMTAAVTAALCVLSSAVKREDITHMDFWNGISFGAIATVVETLHQRNKYRVLYQERQVAYLSQTDVLTGVKNRNHFEQMLNDYPHGCEKRLTCVYADANGLHELNNTQGHLAGDCLLIATAQALIEVFGSDHIYRIGGDEFVCLIRDARLEEVRGRMAEIEKKLAGQGYSISWGAASAAKPNLDMKTLTQTAEQEMYAAKRRFYQQSGRDRRR